MHLPIFFISSLFIIILVQVKLRKTKPLKEIMREYFDEERLLNLSQKKEIGEEYFVRPDLEQLPLRHVYSENGDGMLARKENYVVKRADFPMIKFKTSMSNRELKSKFGIANFTAIVDYEENFNIFIKALVDWAQILMKNGDYNDAEQVLCESIRLGSDYMKNFTMLADIYAKTEQKKLDAFIDEIQNSSSLENSPHVREKSLEYIKSLYLN